MHYPISLKFGIYKEGVKANVGTSVSFNTIKTVIELLLIIHEKQVDVMLLLKTRRPCS